MDATALDRLLNQIAAAVVQDDYAAVLRFCEEALAAAPGHKAFLYYSAQAHLELGRDSHDAAHLMEACGLAPGSEFPFLPLPSYLEFAQEFLADQANAVARGVPALVITALSKSASSFVTTVIRHFLDVPVCRIALNGKVVRNWAACVASGGATTHEHWPATGQNLGVAADAGIQRVLIHIRDPRQALISMAHQRKTYDAATERAINYRQARYGKRLTAAETEHAVERIFPNLVTWIIDWCDRRETTGSGVDIKICTFEQMVDDAPMYFAELFSYFGVVASSEVVSRHLPRIDERIRREGLNPNFWLGHINEWTSVLSQAQRTHVSAAVPLSIKREFGWQDA